MNKSILFILGTIVILSGCGQNKVTEESSSTKTVIANEEKSSANDSHNLTEEDRKLIQLIKEEKFDEVISKTSELNNVFQKDYYFIASAFKKNKDLNEKKANVENYDSYAYIEAMLDKVKYSNDHSDLNFKQFKKDNLDKIKSLETLKNQNEVKDKNETEEYERKKQIEDRTLNPQSISIGMTEDDVLINGWGRPTKVNTNITKNRTLKQWVYKGNKYLYFEDGILTSISK
ncbi:hypothetical protein [Bacillus pumilus]|uniref:Lipoprotein n=1 Tax=Bacillus pumilus TaxID=1408 RepID=A0AAD0HNE8_BACPU|nr:hypothetical protein [Bacillus pumilus]AVM24336.1 hypothetical protein C5695_11000 [Bacillus pumilus]TYS42753.1 hypothetical protein FZC68_10100 [Bacillus pumilus]